MAVAYGRPPSTWVMTPVDRGTPEGQAFAYDFDQTVFLLGRTLETEQLELRRREAEMRKALAK